MNAEFTEKYVYVNFMTIHTNLSCNGFSQSSNGLSSCWHFNVFARLSEQVWLVQPSPAMKVELNKAMVMKIRSIN